MGSIEQKPTAPFNIIVVGAGIGGLSAAIALSRYGCNVTILESKPELNEFGASIGIWGFATKILQMYGLESDFGKYVVATKQNEIRDGFTNKLLGRRLHNHADSSQIKYGAPMWIIHRVDYQQVLAKAAERYGAKILFNAQAEKVDIETQNVHLKDGRTLSADLIVGADGLRSPIRRSIPATAEAKLLSDPEVCYRCSVPKKRMRQNPLLAPLLEQKVSSFWYLEERYVLSWIMPENRDFDVVAGTWDPEQGSDLPLGSWGIQADVAEVVEHFTDANPIIQALLPEVSSAIKWRLVELESLTTCRSPNGQTVLVGDAHHGMFPHMACGGSSAIEDGAVLGECVAWAAKHGRSIADATKAYDELRVPRVTRLQQGSRDSRDLMTAARKEKERWLAGLAAIMKADEEDIKRSVEERKASVPEMDMNARWPDPKFIQWCLGYDAVKDAREYLASQ